MVKIGIIRSTEIKTRLHKHFVDIVYTDRTPNTVLNYKVIGK